MNRHINIGKKFNNFVNLDSFKASAIIKEYIYIYIYIYTHTQYTITTYEVLTA